LLLVLLSGLLLSTHAFSAGAGQCLAGAWRQ
jgi:hypothetical protein